MSTGHLAAGLILKKAGKSGQGINAGLLWLAALLLDFLNGFFVILGIEHMPAPGELVHLNVSLPYSHGFLSTLVWASLAFLVTWLATRKRRPGALLVAAIVAAAVLSHNLLDVIAYMLGLSFAAAQTIELALILTGAVVSIWAKWGQSWLRRLALVVVMLLYGVLNSAPPNSISRAAVETNARLLMTISLAFWAVLVLAAYFLDREGGKQRGGLPVQV